MKYVLSTAVLLLAAGQIAADENDYYQLITVATSKAATVSRSPYWKPGKSEVTLEVSGMTTLDDGRLAVSTRKGDIYFLSNAYSSPPAKLKFHRFATSLHEPLGLLQHKGSLLAVQRSEVTRISDTDGDEIADLYQTVAKGWGVTGNYHEYAYGPKADKQGNLWVALNIGMGKGLDATAAWRGWALKITADGKTIPVCAGMRSPCGIGANAAGDMFATDQQGDWIGTCSLLHLRPGVFFGHPQSLVSTKLPGSPLKTRAEDVPSGLPWPQALKKVPQLRPPAVWFPYKKMGQSATDVVLDNTGGKFGPFAGQLFVGEFRLANVMRVYLEKVNGEYQGACFPFRDGFPSAVLRLNFGKDGSLFAGHTNRGWSSIGSASYGLSRLVWTGRTPFEIHQMHAMPDGFKLKFTRPVDPAAAGDPASYNMKNYTYLLHRTYGSPEVLTQKNKIVSATVSEDNREVYLKVDGLRAGYVHELVCSGVRDPQQQPLLHDSAYYTLNAIPTEPAGR